MDTPDLTTSKRCTKCDEVKPLDQFSKYRRKKDGLQPQCKACNREYRQHNAERKHEYNQEYYRGNIEHIRESQREYYQENIEHIRNYRRKNADHISEQRREYSQTPGGKTARTAAEHHYRARKKDTGGSFTAADLAAIRAAQTDRRGRLICWRCNKPITDTPHLDHWIPLKHGGANSAGNLHYMHAKCNLTKHSKHPTELGRLI